MMIHILQHTSETPPGSLQSWLRAKNHESHVTRLYAGEALPSLSNVDWLIILGGGMNVDEVGRYPWLKDEKKFVEAALVAGKPLLGLCLGAQMLAQVLGSSVKPHSHWEVGWHQIQFASSPFLPAQKELMAFQWHQDTFDIPLGATKIATNEVCGNQGFTYGDHVIGLQFHPESSEEWIRDCAENERPYPQGPFVQSPETILSCMHYREDMQAWFFTLLDQMAKQAEQRKRS